MPNDVRLMPRLDEIGVRRLLGSPDLLREGTMAERLAAASSSITHAASGGSRASQDDLQALLDGLTALAVQHGFPNRGRATDRATFDAACGAWLGEGDILHGPEAMRDDVWACVACCIAPGIVLWRFEDGHPDRFRGGVRNTFQRLWLRACAVDRGEGHKDRSGLLRALSEDASVQITERPGIGADSNIARALAEAWVVTSARVGSNRMEPLTRRAVRMIRRDNEITCFGALSEQERLARVQGFFERAEKA